MLFRYCLTAAVLAAPLLAQTDPSWSAPFPPHRIVENLYYVGTKGLASYLVVTPQGNILINSSLETSVPLIRASIEKLGFRFGDTKILLISHAHWDHCAGSARVKEFDGCEIHGDGCRCSRDRERRPHQFPIRRLAPVSL